MEEKVPVWIYRPDRESSCTFTTIEGLIEQIKMDIEEDGWMGRENQKAITITPKWMTKQEIEDMPEFGGW